MDKRLVEAARGGDVGALHRIMEEDPDILEKESLGHSADSTLHVAARRGKADFVKEIVSLMPSLATATNQKGLIPLHMASAQGHVETVKELLKARLDDDDNDQVMTTTTNQCLVKEDEGWTPLHYAVFRGRVGVVKELISHCSVCVEEVTAKRETVLHLAVKANQLKVIQVIVESIKRLPNFQTLVEAKEINGKTVSDLAAAKKDFLAILAEKGKEGKKDEIKEETCISVEAKEDGIDRCNEEPDQNKEKKEAAASAEFENAVIVVAALIITLTYQGLANPPSTLIQPGTKIDWSCLSNPSLVLSSLFKSFPALKFLKSCPAYLALLFLAINSVIFTLSILLLLSSLRGPGRPFLLLRLLAIYLIMNYCVLLEAFTYYAAYATAPMCYLSAAFFIYLLCKEYRIKEKAWRKSRSAFTTKVP